MTQQKTKHCLVCKCELPSDYKLPVCRHHRDVAKDGAKRAGSIAISAAGAAVIGIKTKSFSKAADFLKNKIQR